MTAKDYCQEIWPVPTEGKGTPHEAFFYHEKSELQTFRSGRWKIYVTDAKPTVLYDLDEDIGGKENQLSAKPDIARRSLEQIASYEADHTANSGSAAFVNVRSVPR